MAEKKKDDAGQAEVQQTVDEEQAQGFRGTKVDPTPDENYTVAGVTAGKSTPETDPKLRAQAEAAMRGEIA
jgi:hypothetical protein